MNERALNLNSSKEWLEAGKMLVHPTESIWGLGCDAFNKDTVQKIFNIKNRRRDKNFILLAKSYESIKYLIKKLNTNEEKFILDLWPGPYTFLFRYSDSLPEHLKNKTGKIAIRVSNHLPIKSLFKAFSGFMISTSANISGKENLKNPEEIINYFEYAEMAYYDELIGTNANPSKIIDLETKAVIRP